MALNTDLQILTQPATTGQQTYSLTSNFDPKAVMLWASFETGDGTNSNIEYSVGYGSYRGGVVQQGYSAIFMEHGVANADNARGSGRNAILKLLIDGSADLEVSLVSMQTGTTSEVVLDWTNLHTTASVRVFMLVLGGSDISDAYVNDFVFNPAGSTTQDFTVLTGFGQPDLLLFASGGQQITQGTSQDNQNTDARFGFGFGKKGEAGRGFGWRNQHGTNDSTDFAGQRSDKFLIVPTQDAGLDAFAQLDTVTANWPTDGFRVVFDALSGAGTGRQYIYLALKGTFQAATGDGTAPTTGTPPVVQDLNAGFTPKLGLIFGWHEEALTTVDTSDSRLMGFALGAYDGDQEASAGMTSDDAAATMRAHSTQSSSKVFQNYIVNSAGNAELESEADGSFSGNNFRLSWTTVDAIAKQYQWLVLGDAAGGGGTAHEVNVNDTLSLADSLTIIQGFHILVDDTLAISDAIRFDEELSLSDTISIADAISTELGINLTIDDTLSIADAIDVVEGIGHTVNIADTVSLSDAIEVILAAAEEGQPIRWYISRFGIYTKIDKHAN